MLRAVRTVTSVGVLTAALVAGIVGQGTALAAEPGVAAAAPASITAAPASSGLQYYGVNAHSLWSANTPATVERELDLMQGLNANSARVDVSWSSLQTDGRGTINADYRNRIDALVDGAARRGIAPVLVLNTTPCWASTAPESLKQNCAGAYWDRGVTRYPPAQLSDFAWAASWVAQRYAGRIAALELWNEPNYDESFSNLTTADKPGVYTAMVKAAYPAIKSVAPSVPVLMGSTAFADYAFLAALYNRGIKGFYDGVSVHPYNEQRSPGAAHDARWAKYDYVLGLQAVRQVMTAAGDNSPVWVTEVGWTDCTVGADKWCVTEDQQAQYNGMITELTVAKFPWVRAVLLYNLRDKGTDAGYTEDNFGLVTRDYSPKRAYATVRASFGRVQANRTAPVEIAPAPAAAPAPSGDPVFQATRFAQATSAPTRRRFAGPLAANSQAALIAYARRGSRG